MKKVLVLASLGLIALSFGCGGGSDTPKVADKETAAGMSSVIFSAAGESLFVVPASINQILDPITCPINGSITGELTVIDANSGTSKLTYDKCGAALCDGHIFMNGTLDETYSNVGTDYTYGINGTINFITAAEAEWDVPGAIVYYAGQSCVIALEMKIETTEADLQTTPAEIAAYIESHTTGTVCGYDWTEVVAVDVATDGAYCTTLTL